MELGWPGAAAVFETALADGGPNLGQLANRWATVASGSGSNPSAELAAKLNPRKRKAI